jgi:hypothetical protein
MEKHMKPNKREEEPQKEAQDKEKKNAFVNGQSPESVKKNPNPRANENLPEKDRSKEENTTGAGSEITDGEDG